MSQRASIRGTRRARSLSPTPEPEPPLFDSVPLDVVMHTCTFLPLADVLTLRAVGGDLRKAACASHAVYTLCSRDLVRFMTHQRAVQANKAKADKRGDEEAEQEEEESPFPFTGARQLVLCPQAFWGRSMWQELRVILGSLRKLVRVAATDQFSLETDVAAADQDWPEWSRLFTALPVLEDLEAADLYWIRPAPPHPDVWDKLPFNKVRSLDIVWSDTWFHLLPELTRLAKLRILQGTGPLQLLDLAEALPPQVRLERLELRRSCKDVERADMLDAAWDALAARLRPEALRVLHLKGVPFSVRHTLPWLARCASLEEIDLFVGEDCSVFDEYDGGDRLTPELLSAAVAKLGQLQVVSLYMAPVRADAHLFVGALSALPDVALNVTVWHANWPGATHPAVKDMPMRACRLSTEETPHAAPWLGDVLHNGACEEFEFECTDEEQFRRCAPSSEQLIRQCLRSWVTEELTIAGVLKGKPSWPPRNYDEDLVDYKDDSPFMGPGQWLPKLRDAERDIEPLAMLRVDLGECDPDTVYQADVMAEVPHLIQALGRKELTDLLLITVTVPLKWEALDDALDRADQVVGVRVSDKVYRRDKVIKFRIRVWPNRLEEPRDLWRAFALRKRAKSPPPSPSPSPTPVPAGKAGDDLHRWCHERRIGDLVPILRAKGVTARLLATPLATESSLRTMLEYGKPMPASARLRVLIAAKPELAKQPRHHKLPKWWMFD